MCFTKSSIFHKSRIKLFLGYTHFSLSFFPSRSGPFLPTLPVSAQLDSSIFTASCDRCVNRTRLSRLFSLSGLTCSEILGLCMTDFFTFIKASHEVPFVQCDYEHITTKTKNHPWRHKSKSHLTHIRARRSGKSLSRNFVPQL